MIETKYFCDFCGRQLERKKDLFIMLFQEDRDITENRQIQRYRYEICLECHNEIIKLKK